MPSFKRPSWNHALGRSNSEDPVLPDPIPPFGYEWTFAAAAKT